ncbi:hypothetical protein MMC29_002362 [Sticta canariensis]|nr:hypothetical protein [Sticta canariensis]
MAFTNQFSLSLELTKFIPFGSLTTNASRGVLHLMRVLQDLVSDMITEAEPAKVFGRNRKFESTFRTAVKKSVIQEISEVSEIVLEAGAGPTVRRSLSEPAYFSTILQLSLLTYTHDLSQFARCLTKALGKRAEGATAPVALPRYDVLKGTLRACREQTSGFLWELQRLPVDKKLADIVSGEGPTITRRIPAAVLLARLDYFAAMQVLELHNFYRDMIEGIANANVTSCISLVQKESKRTRKIDVDRREKNMCPSASRIVAVEKLLFSNNHDVLDNLNIANEQPCLATSMWELDLLPENLARHLRVHSNSPVLKTHTLRLSYLLLVLSGVDNLDACGGLSLDALGWTEIDYLPFRLPNVHEAFHTITLLLQGRALTNVDIRIEDVAILSA